MEEKPKNAAVVTEDGAVLNDYGPATHELRTPRGNPFRLVVERVGPGSGKVRIRIYPFRPERMTMRFALPAAPATVAAAICTVPEPVRASEGYWIVDRVWTHGETVDLAFEPGAR
jgi:DUF1680 family protein